MTREECELSITYLEEMKETYIEGNGYERHPLPEYYAIESAIKSLNQYGFAKWVANEIFSDDWELNKNSFEEIACRKLVKLGIVEEVDGQYRLKIKEN